MGIRSQSALMLGVVSLALALATLLRPRLSRGRSLTLFAIFCLSLSAWGFADFVSALAPRELFTRLEVATFSLVPFFALAFFLQFLAVSPRWARRAQEAALLGSVFGLAVSASPLIRYRFVVGAMAVWAYGVLFITLGLVRARQLEARSRLERARLLYLFVGATVAVGLSALDSLSRLGFSWPALGSLATTIYLFFLAQTLQRHRLLDLHELLGRVAAVSSLALMLALVYGVIGFWLKDRPGLFLFNTVSAAFVILSLFEPLRARVEEQVLSSLFRERFELIRTLHLLRTRLATVISPTQMASGLLDTLHETRRVTHASVYLLAEDQPGFRLLDSRGPVPASFIDASGARALLAAAAEGERAVLLENVERRLLELSGEPRALAEEPHQREEAKRLSDVKTAMAQMASAITFPLMGENQVLGFWNLADDRVPEAYSSDEIAAMLEVAERAAVVIENSQLFERMKERDRLAALGEMAAGLAHEIRNPLGAIKGAAQYLHPSQLAGDDAAMMQVIVDEVNRLNGVVSEFLDYSRPLRTSAQPVDVNDTLQHTVRLLESQGLPEKVVVQLSLDASIGHALGDAEQLTQVFLNLALNAIQAMPNGGTLGIRTAHPPQQWRFADVGGNAQRPSPWPSASPSAPPPASPPASVEIRFRDTGPGIPDEAKERIFIPFYTTKEKGTGLGLAICQRIVKAHGGSITVESKTGQGTEFTVRLPGAPGVTSEAEHPAVKPTKALPPARSSAESRRKRRA